MFRLFKIFFATLSENATSNIEISLTVKCFLKFNRTWIDSNCYGYLLQFRTRLRSILNSLIKLFTLFKLFTDDLATRLSVSAFIHNGSELKSDQSRSSSS